MSKTAHFADSDEITIHEAKLWMVEYLRNRTGRENAASSKQIAENVGLKATTVRDLIQEIRREFDIPVTSCSKGYYVLDSPDQLKAELERIDSEIATREQTKQELTKAFNRTNAQ